MLGSRRMLAAVVLGVAVLAAGCGGTDFAARAATSPKAAAGAEPAPLTRDPAQHAALLRSVSLTSAARTAHTSISVTLTGLGDDTLSTGAFDIAGSGVVDLVDGDADLTLSVPLFDRLGGGGAVEHRIVDGVVYTRVPAPLLRAAGLPAAVRWLSLDPRETARADPSALSLAQVDPAGQLAFVAATSDDVREVGTEPVRGVPSTHHAATIDLADGVGGGRRVAVLRAQLARLGWPIAAERLTVDVWLDRTGRARRVVVSVPLSPRNRPGEADLDATLRIQGDFYGFGKAVKVAAPPRAEVRPYRMLRTGESNG